MKVLHEDLSLQFLRCSPELSSANKSIDSCSSDGVVWYSMPQGEKRGADINLMDVTYDGHRPDDEGILTGGLGQLTDGVEGSSNFRLDPLGLGIKGENWVYIQL